MNHLARALDAAVPLWIETLRPFGLEAIAARAKEINELKDSTGQRLIGSDALLHLREGDTANAFNALAEGIACLAFAPGGVYAFGRHWDATKRFGIASDSLAGPS